MTDSSDVVDRADSFMRSDANPATADKPRNGRRRRSFLAAPRAGESDFPDAPPLADEDDDLPVLTEVVPLQRGTVHEAEPPTSPQEPDDDQIAIIAAGVVESVGKQLAYELPALLEATLLNASEDLRAGIALTMEAALRDYLASRKQLALPLEEPEPDGDGRN